ncbi:hypothetical protein, partial [Nostoc sp.]
QYDNAIVQYSAMDRRFLQQGCHLSFVLCHLSKTNAPCPILLYERLRQRRRYFDPSAKLRATRRSVQVSTSAQCPTTKRV